VGFDFIAFNRLGALLYNNVGHSRRDALL